MVCFGEEGESEVGNEEEEEQRREGAFRGGGGGGEEGVGWGVGR